MSSTQNNRKRNPVKINKSFVRTLLGSRGMSLRDLAGQTDIGEATLYRVMNGSAFTSDTLGRLAEALECSPVDLIDSGGYVPPLVAAPSGANHCAR
jgi:DNA-binding Xre family transcriptional regulator